MKAFFHFYASNKDSNTSNQKSVFEMEWVFPYPSPPLDGGSKSSATASSNVTDDSQSYPVDSSSSYGESKGSEPSCTYPPFPTSSPVHVQRNGARSLIALLMACAEAVQENNLTLAESLVKRIGFLAFFQGGSIRKVITYFADALARRIYRISPKNPVDHSLSDSLHQMHFYEACPFLKVAHFTCNQAILEAFKGKERVYVIDFSINEGQQWPALLQALALRPGGPPAFRLLGIGPPSHDNSDYLQEIGRKLALLAETMHVEFEYRGFITESLADLSASILDLRPCGSESVAVNSVFELHKLLARPGAIDYVLSLVKQMEPEVVSIVEQEATHNGPVFLDRFTESLGYYSDHFDLLEASIDSPSKAVAEVYLGKQICNIVTCEGADRVERHETLTQWRTRLDSAGFVPFYPGANAFRQARALLGLFAKGDEYRVEENNGCLTLGCRPRPLVTISSWQLAEKFEKFLYGRNS